MEKKGKKTRIMALGDVHGDERLIKKAAEKSQAENVDIVILTGDITLANNPIRDIIGPFVKAKKRVLLIPGNHEGVETIDFFAQYYDNTKSIHGYFFINDGVGIFGAGGANICVYRTSEKEIRELLERGHRGIKDLENKIMVTHMHPKGTKSEFSGFVGSEAVRKAIEKFKPKLALFSHIHEASVTEDKIGDTLAVNVSRRPRIFEI